ncbi:MAG: SdpI family protein [Clostridia bacterium]|nr:SdpI family protein [Clostridia bacterium]
MGFWAFTLVTNLIVPVLILLFGINYCKNGAPKNIEGHSGFRSRRATKSWDAWVFTHKLAGKIWRIMGLVMIPVTVVLMLFTIKLSIEAVNIYGALVFLLQGIAFAVSVIYVENQIKKNFNDYGVRNLDSIEKEIEADNKKAEKELKKKQKSKKK